MVCKAALPTMTGLSVETSLGRTGPVPSQREPMPQGGLDELAARQDIAS